MALKAIEETIDEDVTMRIEIEISDERPEAKILKKVSDPSAYMLYLLRCEAQRPVVDTTVQDYLAILDQVMQTPTGFKSREEVDVYINELLAEW